MEKSCQKKWLKILILSTLFFLVASGLVIFWSLAGKKLISLGGIPGSGGQPSPLELAPQVDWVAQFPVDGFVFNVSHEGGYLPDAIFNSGKKITYQQVLPDVQVMQSLAPKLGKVKETFIRLNIGVTSADWFDDAAWEVITINAGVMAKAAKETGAVGILLDPEEYGYYANPCIAPFDYTRQKKVEELTFAEYNQQVRKRGAEFAGAVITNFPDAIFFFLYATSSAYNPNNRKYPLSSNMMGLIPAFIDGMMDAAPASEFIDGYEGAYYFKTREAFVTAREIIKDKAASFSADPERYRKRMQAGFGVYLHGTNIGKPLTTDFTNNSLTPEKYRDVVGWALELSDGYVWIYAENPWKDAPPEYIQAIRDAQKIKSKTQWFFRIFRGVFHRLSCSMGHDLTAPSGVGAAKYTFYAKKMKVFNTTPDSKEFKCFGCKNWWIGGEYVGLATNDQTNGVMNCTGMTGFSPKSDQSIQDGVYKVVVDICHDNVKKHNYGDPAGDRNGSFAYFLHLADNTSGKLEFLDGSKPGWNTCYPEDPDNGGGTPYYGTVALTNFVAYGPGAAVETARGMVKLTGVKASDLVFELWDQVVLNYGIIGLKSIKLVPEVAEPAP